LCALVLLVALIGAAARWGVPALAESIADALPPSVDKSVGEGAVAAMEARKMIEPSRFSDERLAEIHQVLRTVLPARPRVPLRLLVRQSKQLGANALALPDGTIILTDAMVLAILDKKTTFGDFETAQLAGVLAHEIGHIEQRHGARLLARSSLMAAFSAALLGDFSAVAAAVPATLVSMQHSREMETDADSYAISVLKKRGLPLAPLAHLLEVLGQHGEDAGAGAADWAEKFEQYISSHPQLAKRGARLRQAEP
jgi:Zn-dependent protease with chaperone function